MVYQITYDISQSSNGFFKTLESLGDFVFFNKNVFINTNLHKSELISMLKSEISDDDQIFVKSIDIDGDEYPKQISSWVGNIKFEILKAEIEQERNKKIKKVMSFLDNLEIELEKQIIEGNGDNSATEQSG